jgi:ribosomal protein S18 acetylase RimI-like enzyme
MITLRAATPEDIPLLQELAQAIWHQVFTSIITPEQTDLMLSKMYDAVTIRREMANGTIWKIARDGTTPIGYLSYSMITPEECKLHKIYLDPAHHGKGLGKILMQDALEYAHARQARLLSLRVNRANHKAIRAYHSFGFTEAESIDWEFIPGFHLHDFRMLKPLDGGSAPRPDQ